MLPLFASVILSVNHLTNSLGVHDPKPALSWQMEPIAGRRGLAQTAYEIRVSSRPDGSGDLWDSGRIAGDASIEIPYGGRPLPSRTRAWWQVTVWDDQGIATTSPANASFWETGLLARQDWSAQWIGAPWQGAGHTSARAPYLRRDFSLRDKPVAARLYVTALGLYEVYLNGHRVGDGYFTPGWTDTRKRVQYQVYDVTDLLASGDNVVGAILGDGWYCGNVAQKGRQLYGDRPKLLAQLETTYADGHRETLVSDGTWQLAGGPILENDLLMGESYDARQELPGWLVPHAAGVWQAAQVFAAPEIELSPSLDHPVTREQNIRAVAAPVKFGSWSGDRFIYDFGQNLVGNVTVHVKAPAGTTIRLRFAEMLDAGGDMYVENLRTARATDFYTCKGDPAGESWTPRFTFHGFRYAELSGLGHDVTPATDALVAHVLHTDIAPAGEFSCSDPLVNQLQHNIQWGQRGNYFEVPTDCPQRDERLGWTGDAQAFIRTGAWNRDVAAFFTKWQRDIGDAQGPDGAVPAVIPSVDLAPADGGPGWADAAVICPWTIYACYGDRPLLEKHYEEIRRYVDSLAAQSVDDIRLHPSLGRWAGFGDWLALDGSGKREGGTPKDLIATAFYVYDARLLAAMAHAIGREEDARRYEGLADRVTKAFQRRFVTADGLVAGNTQTSYVLALHFDLVPVEMRPKLVDALVRDIHSRGDKLSTGFIGTPYLLHELVRGGQTDLAYTLLLQKDWPSWLYAVTQGATTMWERWDGWTRENGFQDKGMNSFNHYAYGAVGAWLYQDVAGIDLDPAHPGYKHFVLQPRPGGSLTSARASHQTPFGEVSSSWQRAGNHFDWDVVVPPNTTASVRMPVPARATLNEGAKPLAQSVGVSKIGTEDDAPVFELASGEYHFHATW
ncbi:MAG TPA: glycoside hydrolase family 78 protein [Candidatus Didemnitutus sp.]|nr:glycoside hydrolase family 78 protein [Candidatus Didemnitutus sp.]